MGLSCILPDSTSPLVSGLQFDASLFRRNSDHGVGVPVETSNNILMHNECIEQCAIYTFLLVGPT